MKASVTVLFFMAISVVSQQLYAQEIPVTTEQQLENLAEARDSEPEDDTWQQEMEWYRKHPINVNKATEEELKQLRILTEMQVQSLLRYRKLLGPLISIYELQAVPYWDVSTIRKLSPYLTITSSAEEALVTRMFRSGEHSFLLRVSQRLARQEEYSNAAGASAYKGSPQQLFIRYRYVYKNIMQYGATADKDAGEQFFGGAQKKGFDFYSFHLFLRQKGLIKAVALGDYTVNMGQGLIQWQSLAFKKSADAMAVKRQSPVIRPYSAAGEFYFNRGAAITIQKGKTEATIFASMRKLNANIVTDTLTQEEKVSSILTSGYNRTAGEQADKNRLTQWSAGGNVRYKHTHWHIGINAVAHRFSLPIQKRDEPYNLFAIQGKSWYNCSSDYSFTIRNIHFFGEAAIDKKFSKAVISGLLLSADPRLDMVLVYRHIGKSYQAMYANAFTENTASSNEKGLYIGAIFRPVANWRADMFYDIYRFAWLKYRVDAPSAGRDFLLQLTVAPGKKSEIYIRYKEERKEGALKLSAGNGPLPYPGQIHRRSCRAQLSARTSPAITIRSRTEMVWFTDEGQTETGFSGFLDVLCKPPQASWGLTARIQYYDTESYDTRMYSYENDVAYSYTIPAIYGRGCRYYIICQKDIGKKLQCWLRWAGYIQPSAAETGSSASAQATGKSHEIRLQARISF